MAGRTVLVVDDDPVIVKLLQVNFEMEGYQGPSMPPIRDILSQSLAEALATLGLDVAPADIHLERPARREHGDWSSNVALTTAKAAGRKPRDLAEDLRARLVADPPAHVA